MINVAVLGYGTVGSGIVEVFNTNQESINKKAGNDIHVKYVLDSREKLDDRESFVRYLLDESSQPMLQEFQRFLQKGCLSSFVCVIAKKKEGREDE